MLANTTSYGADPGSCRAKPNSAGNKKKQIALTIAPAISCLPSAGIRDAGNTNAGRAKSAYIERYTQTSCGTNGIRSSAGAYRCHGRARSDVSQFMAG